jgi:hypothetical protein
VCGGYLKYIEYIGYLLIYQVENFYILKPECNSVYLTHVHKIFNNTCNFISSLFFDESILSDSKLCLYKSCPTSRWNNLCKELEWLLFNTKWDNFQPYHDENKLHFDEMMIMMSAVYSTNTPRAPLWSWFRVIQSLFLLINAACLAEKQQIPIL